MRRLLPRFLVLTALALPLGLFGSAAESSSLAGASSAKATADFPAVKNATNLKIEPIPGKGHVPVPTKFAFRNLVKGHGKKASATSTVEVQYIGTSYLTGVSFDSSWSRGEPSSFPLTGVIPGFTKGITGMRVGGRREIVIPPVDGYGADGTPPNADGVQAVGPNETLVFVVDLLKVSN